MTILNGQYYPCVFYPRFPDSRESNDVGIFFNAQVVGDREKSYNQRLQGFNSIKTRTVLRTNSPFIFSKSDAKEIQGYVRFQNQILQIESIVYDNNHSTELGAGRFSREHNEANAIKLLVLL